MLPTIILQGRKDFVKQAEKAKPDASTAEIQPAANEEPENIYENIEDVKPGADLGEGPVKKPRKRNAGVRGKKIKKLALIHIEILEFSSVATTDKITHT